MLDEDQLQILLTKLDLTVKDSVLDLGCGAGLISEYISDETGARVTGLDFTGSVIDAAELRTATKRGRLNFITEDLNSLPESIGTFDVILSIDTLYFVDDLKITLQGLGKYLKPNGRIAAFYSCKRKEDATSDALSGALSRLERFA